MASRIKIGSRIMVIINDQWFHYEGRVVNIRSGVVEVKFMKDPNNTYMYTIEDLQLIEE